MPVKLHRAGLEHARSLVASGRVKDSSSWTPPSPEEENGYIKREGLEAFGRWHLAVHADVPDDTKDHFGYIFTSDFENVDERAIGAIRQRSAQQGAQDVFDAAGTVAEAIDAKRKKSARSPLAALSASGEILVMSSLSLERKAPCEIQLMPLGRWDGYVHPTTKKPMAFEVTPDHVRAAVAYQTERKARNSARDLVIDYEHQTLSGGVAPAAGWIGDLKDGGSEGLIGTSLAWTDKARAHIEADEYRYISPVFAFNHLDKVTGRPVRMALFNAALTNEPFFDELRPLVSKDSSLTLFLSKEDAMNPVLEFLFAFLALAASAKPEEVTAKANEFLSSLKEYGIVAKEGVALTAASVIEQLKAGKAKLDQISANYALVAKALKADEKATPEQLVALIAKGADTSLFVSKSDYDALLARMNEKDVDEIIGAAIAKGKITPATKETLKAWAMKDLDGFKAYLAKIADFSVVPLQKIEEATALAPTGEDGMPSVDAIKAYAAKEKVTFKEAAIALTAKGKAA